MRDLATAGTLKVPLRVLHNTLSTADGAPTRVARPPDLTPLTMYAGTKLTLDVPVQQAAAPQAGRTRTQAPLGASIVIVILSYYILT